MATGQEATGDWTIPEPLRHLSAAVLARASDPIDFEALRGKKVVVIGAGATAFDNAATALEAGAAEVHLFCRRSEIQDPRGSVMSIQEGEGARSLRVRSYQR